MDESVKKTWKRICIAITFALILSTLVLTIANAISSRGSAVNTGSYSAFIIYFYMSGLIGLSISNKRSVIVLLVGSLANFGASIYYVVDAFSGKDYSLLWRIASLLELVLSAVQSGCLAIYLGVGLAEFTDERPAVNQNVNAVELEELPKYHLDPNNPPPYMDHPGARSAALNGIIEIPTTYRQEDLPPNAPSFEEATGIRIEQPSRGPPIVIEPGMPLASSSSSSSMPSLEERPPRASV